MTGGTTPLRRPRHPTARRVQPPLPIEKRRHSSRKLRRAQIAVGLVGVHAATRAPVGIDHRAIGDADARRVRDIGLGQGRADGRQILTVAEIAPAGDRVRHLQGAVLLGQPMLDFGESQRRTHGDEVGDPRTAPVALELPQHVVGDQRTHGMGRDQQRPVRMLHQRLPQPLARGLAKRAVLVIAPQVVEPVLDDEIVENEVPGLLLRPFDDAVEPVGQGRGTGAIGTRERPPPPGGVVGLPVVVLGERRVVAQVGPVDEFEGQIPRILPEIAPQTLADRGRPPRLLLLLRRLVGEAMDAEDERTVLHRSGRGALRVVGCRLRASVAGHIARGPRRSARQIGSKVPLREISSPSAVGSDR